RTEFQTSCAAGLEGKTFAYCCRMNVRTGATSCKVATSTTLASWNNRPSPFGADTNGPYHLSCTNWMSNGSFPFCCRTDVDGATECKYNNQEHINGAWITTTAPF